MVRLFAIAAGSAYISYTSTKQKQSMTGYLLDLFRIVYFGLFTQDGSDETCKCHFLWNEPRIWMLLYF